MSRQQSASGLVRAASTLSTRTLRAIGVVLLLFLVVGSVVASLTLYTLSKDLPSPARLQAIKPLNSR